MGTGNRLSLMLAVVAGASAPAGLKGVRAAETARDGWGSGRLTSALHPGRGLTVAQEDQAPPEQAPEEGLAYPATPPPDLIPEYPPPSPGYGYLWIRGYWDWTGYDWTWNSGFWTPRQAGITFYAPRFIFVNGEPVYYRGYWADPYGRREYGYGWRGAPPAAWRARPSMAPVAWRDPTQRRVATRPGRSTCLAGADAARDRSGQSSRRGAPSLRTRPGHGSRRTRAPGASPGRRRLAWRPGFPSWGGHGSKSHSGRRNPSPQPGAGAAHGGATAAHGGAHASSRRPCSASSFHQQKEIGGPFDNHQLHAQESQR